MSSEALNVNEFMDRVQNDKELFFELLGIFMNDFKEKRIVLEGAFKSDDFETIEHVAHFLKGSCGNISAGALRGIFSDLEKQGRDNKVENRDKYLSDIDARYAELVQYIDELKIKLS